MSPVDTSITSAGNTELSPLDIEKINCLYNCDGTNIGTCGGHQMGRLKQISLHISDNFQHLGTEGVVESSGASAPNGCKWLLAVEEGMAIEMSFESFNVNICFKDMDLFKELC